MSPSPPTPPPTTTTTTTPSNSQTGDEAAAVQPPQRPNLHDVRHARFLPVSPSYFSRTPRFNDELVRLNHLVFRHGSLPTVPRHLAPKATWKSVLDYRRDVAEHVKATSYALALGKVKRLASIQPEVMPDEVREALAPWRRDIDPHLNVPRERPVDRFGRALGVGRRKTSVARAWVVEGDGSVLVNGRAVAEAFGRVHDRESAVWPLRVAERLDKYNVWALVEGGGSTGQAEALAMAVAKALITHEPALKPILRKAGCITRDPRMVERKKHGRSKARKGWVWNAR